MSINLDKINRTGYIQAIKNVTENNFAQGQMVQLGDYIEGDIYEATDALDAAANKPIVLHASVVTKDQALRHGDELKPEQNGRGYHLETGAIITLPKTMFDDGETLAKGDLVEPQASEQTYKKVATDPTYGFAWEIIEDGVLYGEPAFTIAFIKA